jgi:predicted DNA-binding protein (MmcQ/YjbR family)
MTREEFNAVCGRLKATSHVVQWGGADVWKVGPTAEHGPRAKVFAVGGLEGGKGESPVFRFSFKVSEIAWEILKDANGCRSAPYLAARGMKWIQADARGGLKDTELRGYLEASHAIVAQGLSRKVRAELGL